LGKDLSKAVTGFTFKTPEQRKEWFQGQVARYYQQVSEIMALVPQLLVGTPLALQPNEYSVRKWATLIRLLNQETAFLTFGGMGVRGEPVAGDDNGHFMDPQRVAVDPDGLVYITDLLNYRCQVFDKDGNYVRTIGGNGQGDKNDQFHDPVGVAVDSKSVYIVDMSNNRIQKFQKRDGTYLRTIELGGNNQFNSPCHVAVEPGEDGHLYVADSWNHRVQVVTKDGAYVSTLIGNGRGGESDQLNGPHGVAVESGEEGRVFVADTSNHRVQVFTKDGKHVHTIGGNGEGDRKDQLRFPIDVAISSVGEVYVSDSGNFRVQVFSKEYVYVRTIGKRLGPPYTRDREGDAPMAVNAKEIGYLGGISVDKNRLYVVDTELCRVQVFLTLR